MYVCMYIYISLSLSIYIHTASALDKCTTVRPSKSYPGAWGLKSSRFRVWEKPTSNLHMYYYYHVYYHHYCYYHYY